MGDHLDPQPKMEKSLLSLHCLKFVLKATLTMSRPCFGSERPPIEAEKTSCLGKNTSENRSLSGAKVKRVEVGIFSPQGSFLFDV